MFVFYDIKNVQTFDPTRKTRDPHDTRTRTSIKKLNVFISRRKKVFCEDVRGK